MKVSGERIVIFGDSLSHPGADSGPAQSEVTEGTNRLTSAPGDMLASILLEQGAAAVLIDAKVGRSAYNYWTREPSADLMGALAAWAPTQVVVMLGTNDIGMGADAELQAFTALKQSFEAMGADVWAVGPMTYVGAHADAYNNGSQAVVDLMSQVFGNHLIDARGLSVNTDRSSDGVHFTPASAVPTAQAIAAALVSTNPLAWWKIAAIAGAGVFGAIALVSFARRRGKLAGLEPLEIEAASDDEIDMVASDAMDEHDYERAYEITQQLSPKEKAKRAKELYKLLRLDAHKDATVHSDTARELLAENPSLTSNEMLELLAEKLDEGREIWLEQNDDAIRQDAADPDKAWEAYREAFLEASEPVAAETVYGELEGRRAPWMMRTIWRFDNGQWTRETFASSDRATAEEELLRRRDESPGIVLELADDKPIEAPLGSTPERKAFHGKTAEAVIAAAQDAKKSTPGGKKAWIGDVAARLNTTPKKLAPVLVKLQRKGLLKLARADHAPAFEADNVASSEITTDGATYHFVQLDGAPPGKIIELD